MKQKKKKKQNIGIGIVFILLIVFVILTSLILKIFDVYLKSSFDGKNNFNISHLGSGGWEVISLSPKDNSIAILNIKTSDNKKFVNLRIPEDLNLTSSEDAASGNVKNVLRSILSSEDANIFDILKINLFLNSVQPRSINDLEIDIDDERVYGVISESLSNQTFLSEKLTIELINSTGETGVGSNVARFITNLGGNVILVNTGGKVEPTSRIYTQKKKAETVKKIQKLLAAEIDSASQPALSDVKIVIGRDLTERFK